MFSLFINLICYFYKINLSTLDRFKLTVYLNTMPFLLKCGLFLFGLYMPNIIYLGIVIAYLHYLSIFFKNDCIKKA